MKKHIITIAALLVLAASATYAQMQASDGKQSVIQAQAPLSATDDNWHVAFTPYAWAPGVDLNVQMPVSALGHQFNANVSTNADWWKVLSHYGPGFRILAADGRIEVSKGKWGAFVDGYWIYTKISGGQNGVKLGLDDRHDLAYAASFTNKTQFAQVNFGPRYLLGTIPLDKKADATVGFELYGGGRVNWISDTLDGSVTLNNILTGSFNKSASRLYAEPMIGLKTIWKFGPNFVGIIRGDVGGWNLVENNTDCDLEAGIAWQCHKNTYLDLAYRARGQWQTDGSGNDLSVRGWLHGPEIGMTFGF